MAILEDGRLAELLVDRPELQRSVGNIYFGKVEAVLPGMQAAFVDIGLEKSAFLHASDLIEPDEPEYADDEGSGNGGRPARRLPAIQENLSRGQKILVQVTKEPISTKGSRVTAQISLPGRYLVYLPYGSKIGVSRKIEARDERARLRRSVRSLLPKDSGGVIVRTAAAELKEEQIERELKSLLDMWKKIQRKVASLRPPALAWQEASLTRGIIRDLFSDQVDALYVDTKPVFQEIRGYLGQVDPRLLKRVQFYQEPVPLFDKFDIEREIRGLFGGRVDLPTGGYIIIEQTEALASIDVNTGRYTGKKDPEQTILRTNLEAGREIARQLRLRDIGGIIVIDFIDMERQANRDKVFNELRAHLTRDRARTKVFEVSELGLIEMTRQRVRPSLREAMTTVCPGCGGSGRVFRPEVVVRRLGRTLRRVAHEDKERGMVIRLHPEVALYLMEDEPEFVKDLRKSTKMQVELRDDPTIAIDGFRLVTKPAGRDVTEKYEVA